MGVKKNLLVTLADENYINQAKQLFSSVYWNAGWKGDYMLLAHEIPEKRLKWFKDKGILVKKCKPIHCKPVGFRNHPPVILDKFYLFTPKFKKWKNIIYLDADIIVRASLDKLIKIKRLGATHTRNRKLSNHFLNYKRINKKKFDRLMNNLKMSYDLDKLTFNSGVLAFNTKIIKRNSFDKLTKLFKKYNLISYSAEETSLNLFFYNNWRKISILYNLLPELIEFTNFIKPRKIKGTVLHFMGRKKPWFNESYFYKEWKNNLEKSEFIDIHKIPSYKKFMGITIEKDISSFKFLFILKEIYDYIDKYFKIISCFIKKYLHKLYYYLKKVKEHQR